MSISNQLSSFLEEHSGNIKMALAHSNFEDAIKVVFEAGYEAGYMDCASLASEMMKGDEE